MPSSRYKDKNVRMVWNLLLLQENEMSPTTVTTRNTERDYMVGGTLHEQGEKSSMLTVSLKLELRPVRANSASVATGFNEYRV